MEIDITSFVTGADPSEFSASRAELGQDAGKITWNNAKDEAGIRPLIFTDDEFEAFRHWASEFGAWDDEHIATWDKAECNALLIQLISGDLRELENLCPPQDGELFDWDLARRLSDRGTISGNIYLGGDGHVYFYMGS